MRINRKAVLEAAKQAAKATKASFMASFDVIKLEGKGAYLYVTGTSQKLSIERRIHHGEQFESIYVNPGMFSGILDRMQDADVELSVIDKKSASIKGGGMSLKMALFGETTWMGTRTIGDLLHETTVKADILKSRVDGVYHAIGSNNPGMLSVFLEFDGKGAVRATALDGYRISVRGGDMQVEFSAVVEASLLKEIIPLLSGDVTVSLYDEAMVLNCEGTTVTMVLTQKKYWDVSRFLDSSKITRSVSGSRDDLLNAVGAALLLDKRLILDFKEDGTLMMQTRSSTGDDFDVSFGYIGEPIRERMALNGAFLMDALQSMREVDPITIGFTNAKSPCFIKADGITEMMLPITVASA